MMNDNLLQLNIANETVDLIYFSETLLGWVKLLRANIEAQAEQDQYDLVVGSLSGGSTHVAAVIQTPNPILSQSVKIAVDRTFQSIQQGTIADLPGKVQQAAIGFQRARDKRPDMQVSVSTESTDFLVPAQNVSMHPKEPTVSLGAIRGRIQSLSSRKGLQFTIWDEIFDRGVQVFLTVDLHDDLHQLWDREAEVVGIISRHPDTGQPISIRNVRSLSEITQTSSGDPRRFKGILTQYVAPGSDPVDVLRRLRDA